MRGIPDRSHSRFFSGLSRVAWGSACLSPSEARPRSAALTAFFFSSKTFVPTKYEGAPWGIKQSRAAPVTEDLGFWSEAASDLPQGASTRPCSTRCSDSSPASCQNLGSASHSNGPQPNLTNAVLAWGILTATWPPTLLVLPVTSPPPPPQVSVTLHLTFCLIHKAWD